MNAEREALARMLPVQRTENVFPLQGKEWQREPLPAGREERVTQGEPLRNSHIERAERNSRFLSLDVFVRPRFSVKRDRNETHGAFHTNAVHPACHRIVRQERGNNKVITTDVSTARMNFILEAMLKNVCHLEFSHDNTIAVLSTARYLAMRQSTMLVADKHRALVMK